MSEKIFLFMVFAIFWGTCLTLLCLDYLDWRRARK